MNKLTRNQQAFTIVELLIATTVFSVVMLLVTFGVIRINTSYYKGVNQANTQNVARSVVDKIAQEIQFDKNIVAPIAASDYTNASGYAVCIGTSRYSVNPGNELKDNDNTSHALIKDVVGAGCSPTGPINNLKGGGSLPSSTPAPLELLSPSMRVAVLTVCNPGVVTSTECPAPPPSTTSVYQIHLRVLYGDDDLVCSPTKGDCNTNSNCSAQGDCAAADLTCKTSAGSQFCAVADINTSVEKRVN